MAKQVTTRVSALVASLNEASVLEGNDYAKGFNAGLRHALRQVDAMRRAKMRDPDRPKTLRRARSTEL